MFRRRILTAAAVLISCLLAFGGFFFIKKLLLEKEKRILSQSGTIPVAETEKREQGNPFKTHLTEEELLQVLGSMESQVGERLHEPFGQQLSMKEAIEKGDEWLERFFGKFAGGGYEGKSLYVSGVLCEKKPEKEKGTIEDELYSYWRVEYRIKNAETTLLLNSVTGQVMRATIKKYGKRGGADDPMDKEQLLKDYGESFSFKAGSGIQKKGNMAYVKLDKGLYAVLSADIGQIDKMDTYQYNYYEDDQKRYGVYTDVWNLYVSTGIEQKYLQKIYSSQTAD